METFESDDGHVFLKLTPGDYALESIREACEKHEVDTGVVVSGIGTFKNLNYHYVPTTDFPEDRMERNEFFELDGAWEVGTIDGAIADGEPHLHIVAHNGDRTVAGHMEEGNEVHLLGEIVIKKVEGLELTRRTEEKNTTRLQLR